MRSKIGWCVRTETFSTFGNYWKRMETYSMKRNYVSFAKNTLVLTPTT